MEFSSDCGTAREASACPECRSKLNTPPPAPTQNEIYIGPPLIRENSCHHLFGLNYQDPTKSPRSSDP
jgi:hypothetical protein